MNTEPVTKTTITPCDGLGPEDSSSTLAVLILLRVRPQVVEVIWRGSGNGTPFTRETVESDRSPWLRCTVQLRVTGRRGYVGLYS